MKQIDMINLQDIRHALFIQPHPDDNEIGAGGTIAVLRKHGVKVYGLSVTKGEGGSSDPTLSPHDIAEQRDKEASKAMACLDVQNLGNLGYHELTMLDHERLVKQLVLLFRELQVDAIFTVDPILKNELHPTHIQVAKAVGEAFQRCGVVHYPLDYQQHQKVYSPKLLGYYFTGNANVIVNITDVMEQKIAAVQAHKSQIDATLLANIYQMAQTNAMGYDFLYAEPLRLLSPVQTHAFAVPEKTLELLPIQVFE